jgi:hypothetical protein
VEYIIEEPSIVRTKVDIAPCLTCGSTDIHFFDYGYYQGNSGGGRCKSCNNESTSSLHWNATIKDWIKIWNGCNDIPTLILREQTKIADANIRIKELKVLSKRKVK